MLGKSVDVSTGCWVQFDQREEERSRTWLVSCSFVAAADLQLEHTASYLYARLSSAALRFW